METKNVKRAKVMPHSIEAEQAVLGCVLIDENVPLQVFSNLSNSDFYMQSHSQIFEAMTNIYNTNRPVDFVTLSDELEKNGILESVGGIEYITNLTNVVPSAANFMHYVNIVKRDSVLRKLIESGQKIIETAYESEDKVEALGTAEKLIFEISQNEDRSSLQHIGDALKSVIDKFDLIAKDTNALRGIPTGLKELDRVTNGLQNSDLILLAARPGVGKTSLAMNIVVNAAINHGKKCAIFSLEMPKTQLAQRALCSVATVNMGKALKGELNVEEWKAIWAANKKLNDAGIVLYSVKCNSAYDFNHDWICFTTFTVPINVDLKEDKTGEKVYKQISNYDDILQYLQYWLGDESLMECADCGRPIKKNGSAKRYCSNCAASRKKASMKTHYQQKKVIA